MKFSMLLLMLSLFLSACSSTSNPDAGDSAEAAGPLSQYDTAWMQRYESVARRAGVRVYWVNLPRREDSSP